MSISRFTFLKFTTTTHHQKIILAILLVLAGSMVLFGLGLWLEKSAIWMLFLLIVWEKVASLTANSEFGKINAMIFDIRQSKRLFGLLGSAEIPARILGGLTAIHQFCRVGRHAITGGCSKIVQDVPPFMIADGNPAVVRGINAIGLQRHGFDEKDIRTLKEAYRTIYRKNLNVTEALALLKEKHAHTPATSPVHELITFIETSQRGIIR